MNDQSELIFELQKIYGLCRTDETTWRSRLELIANQSLNNGLYYELFRSMIFDGDFNSSNALILLASTIKEINPSVAIPGIEKCNLFFIESRLQELLEHDDKVIAVANEIVGQRFWEELTQGSEHSYLHLYEFMNIYYSWWIDFSERMIGAELELQRQSTIAELKKAAQYWLNEHRVRK